jgi:tetratricopeptide (TPR) repeat protein
MKSNLNFCKYWQAPLYLLVFLFLWPCLASSQETYENSFAQAQAYDKDDFFEDAIKHWQKALNANPPANIALYIQLKLSNTYSRLGRLDKTAQIAKSLTESNPGHYDSWFHFANALAGLQQYSQAADAFKKLNALKPQEGLGRVGLAFAQFGNEKPDLAIEALRQAMKIFKHNKNISWHRDCRLAINQIKGFARFPPHFADLWLEKNLIRVQETYLNTVLDLEYLLN